MLEFLIAAQLLASTVLSGQSSDLLTGAQIDELGQTTCANFERGDEMTLVSTTDFAAWITERAPPPKSDYETADEYRLRHQLTWMGVMHDSPVVVLSHPISVTRANSRYDPETRTLTLPAGTNCTSPGQQNCLSLRSVGMRARYLAVEGLERAFDTPLLNVAPETARRLREQTSDDEITLFIIATPTGPYRSVTGEGWQEIFHVGAYCSVYYWND